MSNETKAISPLEIEILLHYHYSIHGVEVENIGSPAVQRSLDKFCALGLMKRVGESIEPNREALACYANKLMNVELPKQVWA